MKDWVARTLLRLYPAPWRREYGPELLDMLTARPLTAGIVTDILQNGLRQRLRLAEPSSLVGLAMLLIATVGFALNIAAPSPDADESILLRQHLLGSNLYILLLIGCGVWTHLRYGGELSQAGLAALKITFLAGIPVMLAGILMLFGILRIAVIGPGEAATTFQQHGFTYTYYSAQSYCWLRVADPAAHPLARAIQLTMCPPSPLGVFISPLLMLPASWLWGLVGGSLGRWIACGQRPLST